MCLTGCVPSGTASCVFTLVNCCVLFNLSLQLPPPSKKRKRSTFELKRVTALFCTVTPRRAPCSPSSTGWTPVRAHFRLLICPLVLPFFSVSSDHCYCLPGLHHIRLSDRVMVGKDGNLYFANLLTEDSRRDYTCNIQYLTARTILAKEPTTLTVNPCEFFCCSRASMNFSS